MYDICDESDRKMFGCSSLSSVIDYITDIGVMTVVTGTKVLINLTNGEHVTIGFGCPTSAHDWIIKHVPGTLVEIVSREHGCEYKYKYK